MELERFAFDEFRVSTGVKELDLALFGGYPKKSSILFIGGVEKEKFIFSYYFLSFKDSIAITTDLSPSEVLAKAKFYGIDLSHVKFIDAYSKQAGIAPSSEIVVNSPSSLTDISISLSNLIKDMDFPRVAFMSYSSSHTCSPESAFSFLKVIEGKIKAKDGILFLVLDKFSHKDDDLKKIMGMVDDYFIFEFNDGRIELKGKDLKIPIKFSISPLGLEVI